MNQIKNGFEKKIGNTVFFVDAKSSDKAKGTLVDRLKKNIVKDMIDAEKKNTS